MARLRHRDITTFSHALKVLYADARPETLSRRVLTTLRTLFACDFASFSLLDLRRSHWHSFAMDPVVREWPGMDVYRQYLQEDPAAVHIMKTRTREAVKISDFYTLKQYQATRLYAEVFQPVGCDRRLGFAVQNSKPVSLAVTLNRRGHDFSEEDRELLNLLRDHLLQANALAQTSSLVGAVQTEGQDRGHETFGVGLIEVDPTGRTRWMTVRADALLRGYFADAARRLATKRLPEELERQIKRRVDAGTAHLLIQPTNIWHKPRRDGSTLKVRLAAEDANGNRQLLLEEEADAVTAAAKLSAALGLTAREGEVLHLLAEGLTNREISHALGNQEATVSKHLERVFAKLGVPNRAAAVRVVTDARSAL